MFIDILERFVGEPITILDSIEAFFTLTESDLTILHQANRSVVFVCNPEHLH